VNEAWPSNWRGLFETHGFVCLDILRGSLWDNTAVELWYRQNLLLFASADYLRAHPTLAGSGAAPLDVVHPALFEAAMSRNSGDAAEIDRLAKAYKELADETAALEAENQRLLAAWSALDEQMKRVRSLPHRRLTGLLRAVGRRFGL
jgi:hypothetical protein